MTDGDVGVNARLIQAGDVDAAEAEAIAYFESWR